MEMAGNEMEFSDDKSTSDGDPRAVNAGLQLSLAPRPGLCSGLPRLKDAGMECVAGNHERVAANLLAAGSEGWAGCGRGGWG